MYLKRKRGRTSSKGKTFKAATSSPLELPSPSLAEWTIVRSAPLSNNEIPVPANLAAPPAFWTAPFLVLARECQLELTLYDALQILTEYVSL